MRAFVSNMVVLRDLIIVRDIFSGLVLIVNNSEGITDSQLDTVVLVDHDTASRASTSRGSRVVTAGATLAPVDEERPATAHLGWLEGLEVEGARTGHRGVMHSILAISEAVLGGRERARVDHALLVWVHVACTLSRVSVRVDVPLARSPDEVARLLIVSV